MLECSPRWRSLLIFSTFLACSSGCSDSAPTVTRSIVAGTVTYAGKPVPIGQIRFLNPSGPSSQAPVTNGRYLLDYKGGVPVGECRVEIDAYEESGPEIAIGAGGKTMKQTVQVLPAKYNAESTLKVEITPDQQNTHNFDLAE